MEDWETFSPRRARTRRDGMPMHTHEVRLEVPEGIGPELERQIREYVKMRELGEQLSETGMIDPTRLT